MSRSNITAPELPLINMLPRTVNLAPVIVNVPAGQVTQVLDVPSPIVLSEVIVTLLVIVTVSPAPGTPPEPEPFNVAQGVVLMLVSFQLPSRTVVKAFAKLGVCDI